MMESQSLFSTALLERYWDKVRTSIWIIPTAFCLAGLLLAIILPQLDRVCASCYASLPGLNLDVAAARQFMSVLATSLFSVGGVSFSVTMVALTLTSGQYGPKALRHFLADTRAKVSLGLFFATAVYALVTSIVLTADDQPRLSVVAALVLAVLAIVEFIGFIHRTASGLQADQLIQRLGGQLRQSMHQLHRLSDSDHIEPGTAGWRHAAHAMQHTASIASTEEGYVQTADYPVIADALREYGALGILRVRPGDFVISGTELIRIRHSGGLNEDAFRKALEHAIALGPIRTPIQDPEFPVTQIQQIAARALSTGINDPGTAITCIDWLTLSLAEVVDSDLPGCVVLDSGNDRRLLVRSRDFAGLLDIVYSPLRQFITHDLQVAACMLDSLCRLARRTERPDRLALLLEQGERVGEQVAREEHPDYDDLPVRTRLMRLRRAVNSR